MASIARWGAEKKIGVQTLMGTKQNRKRLTRARTSNRDH